MTWLRTPYHHHGRIKGVGVDCAMLLAEVYAACGIVERVEPGSYAPDWHLHRNEEVYVLWMLRYARMLPGGRRMAPGAPLERWREPDTTLPDAAAARTRTKPIPVAPRPAVIIDDLAEPGGNGSGMGNQPPAPPDPPGRPPSTQPQPGDAALFKFGRTFSHGAIFVGDGLLIHSYIGRGVILSRIDEEPLEGRDYVTFSMW